MGIKNKTKNQFLYGNVIGDDHELGGKHQLRQDGGIIGTASDIVGQLRGLITEIGKNKLAGNQDVMNFQNELQKAITVLTAESQGKEQRLTQAQQIMGQLKSQLVILKQTALLQRDTEGNKLLGTLVAAEGLAERGFKESLGDAATVGAFTGLTQSTIKLQDALVTDRQALTNQNSDALTLFRTSITERIVATTGLSIDKVPPSVGAEKNKDGTYVLYKYDNVNSNGNDIYGQGQLKKIEYDSYKRESDGSYTFFKNAKDANGNNVTLVERLKKNQVYTKQKFRGGAGSDEDAALTNATGNSTVNAVRNYYIQRDEMFSQEFDNEINIGARQLPWYGVMRNLFMKNPDDEEGRMKAYRYSLIVSGSNSLFGGLFTFLLNLLTDNKSEKKLASMNPKEKVQLSGLIEKALNGDIKVEDFQTVYNELPDDKKKEFDKSYKFEDGKLYIIRGQGPNGTEIKDEVNMLDKNQQLDLLQKIKIGDIDGIKQTDYFKDKRVEVYSKILNVMGMDENGNPVNNVGSKAYDKDVSGKDAFVVTKDEREGLISTFKNLGIDPHSMTQLENIFKGPLSDDQVTGIMRVMGNLEKDAKFTINPGEDKKNVQLALTTDNKYFKPTVDALTAMAAYVRNSRANNAANLN